MEKERNLAVVRRAYESINQSFRTGNYDDLMRGIAVEDLIDHNSMPDQAPGMAGVRQFFAGVGSAFPDYMVQVEELFSDGDTVIARVMTSGTHNGVFWGFPPTGNKVGMEGIEIFRLSDGMITERWGIFDVASLKMQMGMITPPAG